MYYNKNFKQLLFSCGSDLNYISWLIIYVLKIFECTNKNNSFKDYNKMNLIVNFILKDYPIDILSKFLKNRELNKYELSVISRAYFESMLEERRINASILILEKQKYINIYKTKKDVNIYCKKEWLENNYKKRIKAEDIIEDKVEKILELKKEIYELRYNNMLKMIHIRGEYL